MSKRIVHFVGESVNVVVGRRAAVIPVDHDDTLNIRNGHTALTSQVVAVNEDGSFETLNSIYKPLQQLNG